jgi:hypothetical protein
MRAPRAGGSSFPPAGPRAVVHVQPSCVRTPSAWARRGAARTWLAPSGAALLFVVACGPSRPLAEADAATDARAEACPNDLPTRCPRPTPSYATEIGPVIDTHCVPCHAPGGVSADRPLTTYSEVYTRRASVLTQVYSCAMPPADGGVPLAPTERAALLGWLVCGAPNH